MDFKNTFTSFSVKNLEQSKNFFIENLGADILQQQGGMIKLKITDHDFMIYEKQDHLPATYTVLNFEVYDIETTVSDLSEKGIIFEQYENEFIQTDSRGVADMDGVKMAWFKDPSGNILSLIETYK